MGDFNSGLQLANYLRRSSQMITACQIARLPSFVRGVSRETVISGESPIMAPP